ncbi:MAG: hypothetical protein ACLQIB_21870 [Isosphaeraceae bacterium]
MSDDQTDDDELTPEEIAEEERKAAEVRAMIQEHVEAGWTWDSGTNMLTHPADREINMWIHPYSHDVLYSPKLVEALKQQVERERLGGEA